MQNHWYIQKWSNKSVGLLNTGVLNPGTTNKGYPIWLYPVHAVCIWVPAVGEGSLAEVDSPEQEGSPVAVEEGTPVVGEVLHQCKEVGQT